MLEIEELVLEKLTDSEVDGHDAGSGEVNIFIRTDDPSQAFEEVKAILGSLDFWVDARVGYRKITGSKYTVLWPDDLEEFRVA